MWVACLVNLPCQLRDSHGVRVLCGQPVRVGRSISTRLRAGVRTSLAPYIDNVPKLEALVRALVRNALSSPDAGQASRTWVTNVRFADQSQLLLLALC